MRNSVHTRALQRAADLFGGAGALAKQLNVSRVRIDVWLRGDAPVPGDVFLAVVDILLEHGVGALQKAGHETQQSAAIDKHLEPKDATR